MAILFVQHVSIDPRYMRREIKYLITNINVYLFIGFEVNVFSLYKKIMIIHKQNEMAKHRK